MKQVVKKILKTFVSERGYAVAAGLRHLPRRLYLRVVFPERVAVLIPTGGFLIVVDPQNGFTDDMLFLQRHRDDDVTNVMDQYLMAGSIFVDIGMNIGYETLWGSRRVGSSGRVISFEPLPRLVAQATESVVANGFTNVTIVGKALGDECGEMTLYLHPRDAGLSSLVNSRGATQRTKIAVSTLDLELQQIDRIDLIKMDVEGFEFEALRGAAGTLRRLHPPIVFEFTPHLYEAKAPGSSAAMLSFLTNELDYTLYRLAPSGPLELRSQDLEPMTQSLREREEPVNIFARYSAQ